MTDTPPGLPAQAQLDALRRKAKDLRRAHEAGEDWARRRLQAHPPRAAGTALRHADFLHVIARESSFRSWPDLKAAVEARGMDRAQRLQRLKIAVHHGQFHVVDRLLAEEPDLARGTLGMEIALYDRAAVAAALAADPARATAPLGLGTPLVMLCQSRMIHHWPDRAGDMMAIAELLLAHGADVDLGPPAHPGSDHRLSPLYFAIGHAGNLQLGRWLLEHGADPDDDESLYHATERRDPTALRLLLDHGADPRGTNALLRAMDFDDVAAVRLLLARGADPNEFDPAPVGGELPWVIPALHQAARRGCSEEMGRVLLDAGANPAMRYGGAAAFPYARAHGATRLAEMIAARGGAAPLSPEEEVLAAAAEGRAAGRIDPTRLIPAYREILRDTIARPGRLAHVAALVAAGLPHDAPDREGLTPVQVAGWEGLPDIVAWLLARGVDLGHVNGFGGGLLGTIIHGSENCPARASRDHLACARLALEAGVPLPRRAADLAGDPDMADLLSDWVETHPEQVREGGDA